MERKHRQSLTVQTLGSVCSGRVPIVYQLFTSGSEQWTLWPELQSGHIFLNVCFALNQSADVRMHGLQIYAHCRTYTASFWDVKVLDVPVYIYYMCILHSETFSSIRLFISSQNCNKAQPLQRTETQDRFAANVHACAVKVPSGDVPARGLVAVPVKPTTLLYSLLAPHRFSNSSFSKACRSEVWRRSTLTVLVSEWLPPFSSIVTCGITAQLVVWHCRVEGR